MDYKSRSVRLDDETWKALRAHPLSANQLLRTALGLNGDVRPVSTDIIIPAPEPTPQMIRESVNGEMVVPAPRPRKLTKREQAIEKRASSDVTAEAMERDDIDYSDVDSTPTTHVATLEATAPNGQTGKISMENWRARRRPLLKPKERPK